MKVLVMSNLLPTMSLYQEVIHKSRYARWNDITKQRESWLETVSRYMTFFDGHLYKNFGYTVPLKTREEIFQSLLTMGTMTSMRTLSTAGTALESANVSNYNCSFLVVDSLKAFSSHMFVLMNGSGSGFSVENRSISKLPTVPTELKPVNQTIVVQDSREGWCEAYELLLQSLYTGEIPKRDTSLLRAEGQRLKTFGGYSSGPKVLVELFDFTVEKFKSARGRQLKPIEIFDLFCLIANTIVVGGVRRSATICLFDKDDKEMRTAKSGQWYVDHPYRAMANISAVFEEKPSPVDFMDFWRDLVASYAGEPGIFNRKAVWTKVESIGRSSKDKQGNLIQYGVNPCSEILLQPNSFCNLTGVAIRPGDSLKDLKEKVRIATIMGTWQATVTDFKFLPKVWKENVEEERLLGVSLAGILDHPVLSKVSPKSEQWLKELRQVAWDVNAELAKELGINPSASVTAVKPAGNSGELFNVSSGIHPRYSPFYIRTIRQSREDPITKLLKAQGVPNEVSKQNERDTIFSFPIKSPSTAVFAKNITAIEQLENWLNVNNNFATHTVSCTIYVKTDEWIDVAAWVYNNFDAITGLSFLPFDDNSYVQAPYQPITAEQYAEAEALMPTAIDWDQLRLYEKADTTASSQEYACVGGACEYNPAMKAG
jgi:ribonucleoside-triphosphate reductase (thioredoxin)